MESKKFADMRIKNVGVISSPQEVSVNMPFVIGEGKTTVLPVPVSTYYVSFTASDEYGDVTCVIKTSSFSNISNIKQVLDKYENSGERFSVLDGYLNEDGVLDIKTIIPKKYSC